MKGAGMFFVSLRGVPRGHIFRYLAVKVSFRVALEESESAPGKSFLKSTTPQPPPPYPTSLQWNAVKAPGLPRVSPSGGCGCGDFKWLVHNFRGMAGKPGWFRTGFHTKKVEKLFPIWGGGGVGVFLMFSLFKIFNLVFYLQGEGNFNLKSKLSLTILSCFLPLALVVSYTNQSKYRQIDGLFLHNSFTRSKTVHKWRLLHTRLILKPDKVCRGRYLRFLLHQSDKCPKKKFCFRWNCGGLF